MFWVAARTIGFGGQHGYYTDPATRTGGISDSGLILCTYRWYDPVNARWLTRDPIGYAGGINLYGYVDGNPVILIDPEGTDLKSVVNGVLNYFGSANQRVGAWINSKFAAGKLKEGTPTLFGAASSGRALRKELQDGDTDGTFNTETSQERLEAGGKGVQRVNNEVVGIVILAAVSARGVKYGPGSGGGSNWEKLASRPAWGHTWSDHGAKATTRIIGRAASKGTGIGQWTNDKAAAEFLRMFRGAQGDFSIRELPSGLGRIILPNGKTVPATKAFVSVKPDGTFRTAYPMP